MKSFHCILEIFFWVCWAKYPRLMHLAEEKSFFYIMWHVLLAILQATVFSWRSFAITKRPLKNCISICQKNWPRHAPFPNQNYFLKLSIPWAPFFLFWDFCYFAVHHHPKRGFCSQRPRHHFLKPYKVEGNPVWSPTAALYPEGKLQ